MKHYFNIVKRAYLWLFIALGGVLLSWLIFFTTLQLSEEFTGGINVVFSSKGGNSDLEAGLTSYLQEKGFPQLPVIVEESQGQAEIKINARLENDAKVNELSQAIPVYLQQEGYITSDDEIIDQVVIGPSVGAFMQETAFQALGFGILAMVIYMIFSFGAIRHSIAPSILATVVILSTVISVSLPIGAYGIWMGLNSTLQVDTVFIIAILTIIGYGINDVIIIFDRVRENMLEHGEKKDMNVLAIFEQSIWQTMKRSVGTSLSTLLVLLGMYVFGTGVIATFAFTVGVGVIASTLSSIFVAVPTAYLLLQLTKKSKK